MEEIFRDAEDMRVSLHDEMKNYRKMKSKLRSVIV